VRVLLLSVIVAAVAMCAAAARDGSSPPRIDAPSTAEISRYVPFKDSAPKAKRARVVPNTWPFTPTVATGETLSIHLSQRLYAQTDTAAAQQWADLLARLVHGSELTSLEAYFLTAGEISNVCGREALACYGGDRLFAPATDPSMDLSAEAVATHEYGHHVAYHRRNDPWSAVNYGPKRWATYEEVCPKTRAGRLWPGAEDQEHYDRNPGEAWAETYRVLNERKQGLVEAPWQIVTGSLYPNSAALTAAELDVTTPWKPSVSTRLSGSLTKKSRARSFTVATPLDGRLGLSVRPARGERVGLDVYAPSAKRLAHAGTNTSVTICGQRAVKVRVRRLSGAGAFRLSVAKP
jgi:hypothetical protein